MSPHIVSFIAVMLKVDPKDLMLNVHVVLVLLLYLLKRLIAECNQDYIIRKTSRERGWGVKRSSRRRKCNCRIIVSQDWLKGSYELACFDPEIGKLSRQKHGVVRIL